MARNVEEGRGKGEWHRIGAGDAMRRERNQRIKGKMNAALESCAPLVPPATPARSAPPRRLKQAR